MLREWIIQELKFNSTAFWIQAHGLHFASMRLLDAEKFANLIGTLIHIDSNEEEKLINKNYLQFKVELNVHEPLLLGCKVPRRIPTNNQPNGSKLWIEFKYERLHEFCFFCGILSYIINECNLQTEIQHCQNIVYL